MASIHIADNPIYLAEEVEMNHALSLLLRFWCIPGKWRYKFQVYIYIFEIN